MRRIIDVIMIAGLAATISACMEESEQDTDDTDTTNEVGEVTEALTHPTARTFVVKRAPWQVTVIYGYDYSRTSNHLRAFTQMRSTNSSTHVQADAIILGDRSRLLQAATGNSQVGNLSIETGAEDCHRNGVYRVALRYSIRWPDGVLLSNQPAGPNEDPASTICN